MTYAKITLIGNLGADPELAFDNQNRPRLSMRVAVSERARTAGGEEKTTWYRVTIFGRAGAEAIRLRALQGAAMAPAPVRHTGGALRPPRDDVRPRAQGGDLQ